MKLFSLLGVVSLASAVTYRDTTVNKYLNLLTPILSSTQFGKLVDGMAEDMYNCLNKTVIQRHFVDNGYGICTAAQMVKVMTVLNNMARDLGSADKAQWVLNTCLDVIFNNLNPMIVAVEDKVRTMKSNGKTKVEIINQINYMHAQYVTFSRMNTTMIRFKSKLTAPQWSTTFRNLGQISQLGKYFTA
ncbi:hypothetical protein AAVH_11260 [Aphelenchoides avenae]|nr:hypothetical protein AAVH_11260 [Aphelenchus avenae]